MAVPLLCLWPLCVRPLSGVENRRARKAKLTSTFPNPRLAGPHLLRPAHLSCPADSLSLFLPTIIAQLGYASWRAQLLTVPIYALAFLAILVFCWASHRVNQRGSAIAVAGGIAIVGYIVLIATHTAGARLAGAFLAVGGIYAANGAVSSLRLPRQRSSLTGTTACTALLLSWPSENVSPQTKRAVTSGNQIFVSHLVVSLTVPAPP